LNKKLKTGKALYTICGGIHRGHYHS